MVSSAAAAAAPRKRLGVGVGVVVGGGGGGGLRGRRRVGGGKERARARLLERAMKAFFQGAKDVAKKVSHSVNKGNRAGRSCETRKRGR